MARAIEGSGYDILVSWIFRLIVWKTTTFDARLDFRDGGKEINDYSYSLGFEDMVSVSTVF